MFVARVNEDVEVHEVIERTIYLKRSKVRIIDDIKVHILFDTGCMHSFIPLDVVKRLGLC